jgi:hypothetical protein
MCKDKLIYADIQRETAFHVQISFAGFLSPPTDAGPRCYGYIATGTEGAMLATPVDDRPLDGNQTCFIQGPRLRMEGESMLVSPRISRAD